jgi:hypothetical protein
MKKPCLQGIALQARLPHSGCMIEHWGVSSFIITAQNITFTLQDGPADVACGSKHNNQHCAENCRENILEAPIYLT